MIMNAMEVLTVLTGRSVERTFDFAKDQRLFTRSDESGCGETSGPSNEYER